MKPLLKTPYVGLDLETTGLRLGVDRIVQLALVRVEADGSRVPFKTLVNPEMPIPAAASAIHGITDEMVRGAPSLQDVMPMVDVMLGGAMALVVFNGRRFDVPFLQEELLRIGADDPTAGAPVVDVRDVDMVLRPRTLAGVVEDWCQRPHVDAHDALEDVQATLSALDAMLEHGRPWRLPALSSAGPDFNPFDLEAQSRPESERDAVDPWGWFVRTPGDEVRFGKGKHGPKAGAPGATLEDVAERHPDYLQWMLHKAEDIPPPVKRMVEAALDVACREHIRNSQA